MTKQMTKKRRWIFSLAIITFVVGFMATLEMAVRVIYRHNKVYVECLGHATGPLESYGEELGWSLNPKIVQNITTPFGDAVTYRTGIHGFRIYDEPEPAAHETKVVFVGDSVTFGTGANKSFPNEFARISKLKSVNAGVPGYGTDQVFLMTKKIVDTLGFQPRTVIYGFYWNDVGNNVSRLATDFDQRLVVHKPILNLETMLYQHAAIEKNDLTRKYAPQGMVEAGQTILHQSRLLMAAERVIRYRLLRQSERRAPPQFDEIAQNYLAANLDQFVAFLHSHNIEFVVLHIKGGQVDMESHLSKWLDAYCRKNTIRYIQPQLMREDYLPTDFHLSESGAEHVAALLWKDLQKGDQSKFAF